MEENRKVAGSSWINTNLNRSPKYDFKLFKTACLVQW